MLIRLYISLLSGAVFLAALMLVADSTDRIWQVGRASGVAAFVIMTMAVCFGLIQSSKALIKIRIMLQPTALEIHRSLTWAGLTLVGVHAVTLLLIMGYTLTYTVGLGILAACLIVLLIITSELRNKIVSLKVWRTIHYSSFVCYLLFLVHGFSSGTDSREPWMRALYITSLALVIGLASLRILNRN
ncbi:TPA: hypothetical protein DCY43_01885 [candidate division WWE3 bacterium]|uniref:Ferric oxidoreductase domain-containing protein n=2 Tax=Katanobacteria TaxID=422282 RepID=A0A0G1NKP0_UNCKA|nr:MAG: hypothetical protein UW82_C0011G0006 [candidate division WWE3 bacterium GW2011_GWC2_44_9]HAZ29485.1 hypothetical protein [candidate division WWE3 bacterium]